MDLFWTSQTLYCMATKPRDHGTFFSFCLFDIFGFSRVPTDNKLWPWGLWGCGGVRASSAAPAKLISHHQVSLYIPISLSAFTFRFPSAFIFGFSSAFIFGFPSASTYGFASAFTFGFFYIFISLFLLVYIYLTMVVFDIVCDKTSASNPSIFPFLKFDGKIFKLIFVLAYILQDLYLVFWIKKALWNAHSLLYSFLFCFSFKFSL